MTASTLATLTDRQLDDARRDIGETKLRIRLRTDLRPILVPIEMAGESWYYEGAELRCRPDWKPPINMAHQALIRQVRELNFQIEAINDEADRRRQRRPVPPVKAKPTAG